MDDLASLKIDRSKRKDKQPVRRARGGSPWVARGIVLVVLAGLGALFFRPLKGFLDSVRLPRVKVAKVVESHPAAVGAVQGTAANGYVVAARRAALSADTPGRIVELNVTEGSVVKKGDVVARLYADEYAAALERAKADRMAADADVVRAAAAVEAAAAGKQRASRNEAVAQAEVREAEAGQALARSRFARVRKLFEDGIESQDALDNAQAELTRADARVGSAKARLEAASANVEDSGHLAAVARANLEVAKARATVAASAAAQAAATLDKTIVRAPFDGIVVLKDAEVGEVVSPNSQGGSNARGSVCTMVDFDSLEVQADVPETSIASVEVGAAANIYLDAFPGRTYPGRVSRVWPTANRQKGSVEVRVSFSKRDQDLRPDMGVRIVFLADGTETTPPQAEGEPQLLVPEGVVVTIAGKRGAFVLERDTVRFQPIETGETRAGQVIVKSGLSPGQRLVLDPPADLETGSRVLAANRP